jgi:hypothetical protein
MYILCFTLILIYLIFLDPLLDSVRQSKLKCIVKISLNYLWRCIEINGAERGNFVGLNMTIHFSVKLKATVSEFKRIIWDQVGCHIKIHGSLKVKYAPENFLGFKDYILWSVTIPS